MKKALTFLLALALCVPTFAACGGGKTEAETTVTAQAETAAETEGVLTDGLEDTDLKGFSLHILNYNEQWFTWADNRIYAEELTGEIVNDALFERQGSVQERFNCVLTTEEMKTTRDSYRTAVTAGETTYPLVFLNEGGEFTGAIAYSHKWDDVPYIDITRPEWNPAASSVYNLSGKQVALAGNVSLSVASRAVCIVFNKKIYADHFKNDDLYAHVRENRWTLDDLLTIAKGVGTDLNGDGKMDANDLYGLNMGRGFKGYIGTFIAGAGQGFCENDAKGTPVFTMHTNENTLNIVIKLVDALSTVGFNYNEDSTVHSYAPSTIFTGGHTLFNMNVPKDIEKLREMDDDIGILPIPKLTPEQKQYYSASWGGEVLCLAKTVPTSDYTAIGTILQAMSFKGFYEVIPVYKEIALKSKSARDAESADMLDLIFSSTCFNFGTNILYDAGLAEWALTPIWQTKDSGQIVSICTEVKPRLDTLVSDTLKSVAEME